jgi:two-component sensor histidine kinase
MANRPLEIAMHIVAWGIIYAFPFYFMERESDIAHRVSFMLHFAVPVAMTVAFYLNYFVLAPLYLLRHRTHAYFLTNVLLLVILGVCMYLWQEAISTEYPLTDLSSIPIEQRRIPPPKWMLFVRDMSSLVLAISLSAVVRMSRRWSENEIALREAGRRQVEAELINLRNQVNPHFMINTLNNIYALTQFDTIKAQQAIQELSKLLRYVLADSQSTYVPLGKQLEFIRNYIALMRIRFSDNIHVDVQVDIRPNSSTLVPPLVFITLIENAFKHGISPVKPSFVFIKLTEDEELVSCEVVNSNFPKTRADKTASGVGLEQLKRRLDLLYPRAYTWVKGVNADGTEYRSLLKIEHKRYHIKKEEKS